MKPSSLYGLISAASLAFSAAVYTGTLQQITEPAHKSQAHLKLRAIESCYGPDFNPAMFSGAVNKNCVTETMQELKADDQKWRDFSALMLLMGSILSAGVAASSRKPGNGQGAHLG